MNGFLVCPVRGHDADETADIVARLEFDGWKIHWPHRDTNQQDDVGLNICEQNLRAIVSADRVFVIWDGRSQGCLFDLGMAFALGKPLTVLNAPPSTDGKSFQNMMRAWESDG